MPELRQPQKPKPKLNREILKNHGIWFDELYTPSDPYQGLPEHAVVLADALLNFDNLFLLETQAEIEETHIRETRDWHHNLYPPPPQRSYTRKAKSDLNSTLLLRATKLHEQQKENQEQAKEYAQVEKGKGSEDDWVFVLRKHIFVQYQDRGGQTEKFSPYEDLFDRWRCEFNLQWTESINRNLVPSVVDPKKPKPDITYGFSMIEETDETSTGFWKDESATNFHAALLARLLNSYHRTSLPKLRHFGNAWKDLLCFPWAIVEIKPSDESRAEYAYCQAANASSYALQLFEDLVHQATGHHDYNMPLVVTFTVVGPVYKVWVAFTSPSQPGKNCHKMKCVWVHSIASTWGLIALKQIVANMHIWASRILRPKVSEFIGLCRKNQDLENLPWNVYATTRGKDKGPLRNERPRQRTRQRTRPRPSSSTQSHRLNIAPKDRSRPIESSSLPSQESPGRQSSLGFGSVTGVPHVLRPSSSLQLDPTIGHPFSFGVSPFHQYQLSDHNTRWSEQSWEADDTCWLHDRTENDGEDFTVTDESASLDGSEPHRLANWSFVSQDIIQSLEDKAWMVLSGEEFLQLPSVKRKIDTEAPAGLLDTVMRTFRSMTGEARVSLENLSPIMPELNNMLDRGGERLLLPADIRDVAVRKLIKRELRELQVTTDQAGDGLRVLLRKMFAQQPGATCLDIMKLKPLNDSQTEWCASWREIRQEALSFLLDACSGESFEDGHHDGAHLLDEDVDEDAEIREELREERCKGNCGFTQNSDSEDDEDSDYYERSAFGEEDEISGEAEDNWETEESEETEETEETEEDEEIEDDEKIM